MADEKDKTAVETTASNKTGSTSSMDVFNQALAAGGIYQGKGADGKDKTVGLDEWTKKWFAMSETQRQEWVNKFNALGKKVNVVTGIDERNRVVYLSNPLANNIQSATGNTIYLNYSVVDATNHGLVPGDVVYIAAGTGNTTTTSSTYTVFETRNDNSFTTTPAMTGIGSASIYNAILFAERFTNGPYNIQNNGDQIKVTLNISLD